MRPQDWSVIPMMCGPAFIHHSWCGIREAKCLKKLLLGHNIAIDDGDDDDEEEEEVVVVVVVAAAVVVAIILTIIIYHSTLQMITNNSTSELDKNPFPPCSYHSLPKKHQAPSGSFQSDSDRRSDSQRGCKTAVQLPIFQTTQFT